MRVAHWLLTALVLAPFVLIAWDMIMIVLSERREQP